MIYYTGTETFLLLYKKRYNFAVLVRVHCFEALLALTPNLTTSSVQTPNRYVTKIYLQRNFLTFEHLYIQVSSIIFAPQFNDI